MNDLKDSFLKKYGVWEYVIFLAGLAILGRAVYSLIVADLKDTSWEEFAFIFIIFSLGVLAIAAPKAIVDFAKKKTGVEHNCDDDAK